MRATVLMHVQRRDLGAEPVGEEIVRIEGVVSHEFEYATVERIGPGFGDHGGNTAAGSAIHRGIAVGLHAHFFDAVYGGQHGQAHDAGNVALVEYGNAVELEIR